MNTEFSLANWKRSFFTIWGGQAFSLLGSSLAGFALVWWLTSTTGSATVLAFGTLMQVLPQILLGPLLGTLVDRWNRRLVMIVSDSVIAAFSLGLTLLFWQGKVSFWHVYIILFVKAVGGVFHLLAMQASTPLMVPESQKAFAGFLPIWEYEPTKGFVGNALRERFGDLEGFDGHIGQTSIRAVHHYLMGGWGLEDTPQAGVLLAGEFDR